MLCKKYETKLYILLVTLEVKTSFIRSGSSNLYCNLFSVLNIANNFACHCISSGCDFQSLCCVYVCMSVLLQITSSHIERYVFLNEYLWNVDHVAIKIRLTTYTIWYFAQTHPFLGIYHSLMASYLTYGLIAKYVDCTFTSFSISNSLLSIIFIFLTATTVQFLYSLMLVFWCCMVATLLLWTCSYSDKEMHHVAY